MRGSRGRWVACSMCAIIRVNVCHTAVCVHMAACGAARFERRI